MKTKRIAQTTVTSDTKDPFTEGEVVLVEGETAMYLTVVSQSFKRRGTINRDGTQTVISEKSRTAVHRIRHVYCTDCRDGFNIAVDSDNFFHWLRDGYLTCEHCETPLIDSKWSSYIHYLIERDYVELEEGTFSRDHELGASELCMHTGTVENKPIRVWVNPAKTYAYALLDDGSFIDGCFDLREDGSISLS